MAACKLGRAPCLVDRSIATAIWSPGAGVAPQKTSDSIGASVSRDHSKVQSHVTKLRSVPSRRCARVCRWRRRCNPAVVAPPPPPPPRAPPAGCPQSPPTFNERPPVPPPPPPDDLASFRDTTCALFRLRLSLRCMCRCLCHPCPSAANGSGAGRRRACTPTGRASSGRSTSRRR